jgi:hypothetical protein
MAHGSRLLILAVALCIGRGAAAADADASPLLPRRVGRFSQAVPLHRSLPPGLPDRFVPERVWLDPTGSVRILSKGAVHRFAGGRFETLPDDAPPPRDGGDDLAGVESADAIRQRAASRDGSVALATAGGLFERIGGGRWEKLAPRDRRGLVWGTGDVRGVAYDAAGRLVVAMPAGVARRRAGRGEGEDAWEFFTGADGVPVTDFTVVAAAPDGTVWFGTRRGAIEWRDGIFRYRQGPRWLPGDDVHDLVVDREGNVCVATDGGLGWIAGRSMTLADKARLYEEEIERSIARTEHRFVATADLDIPGDVTTARRTDSDNDGLWTAMYGAAQCYAYAHDRSPEAKRRADRAFGALAFLQEVTQGGEHAPPPGFPARTVLAADAPDPNIGQAERDARLRAGNDPLWKVLEPRWPKSADGRWWWKADTSSDELDGHFFFLALYHDLVAESPVEKEQVRRTVARLTDHLVDHGFRLVDHDGRTTRWGDYSPSSLNHDSRWQVERGLNSMSMLAYLAIAGHVTGDPRYAATAAALRRDHAYAANCMVPKVQRGIGSGNQSDDEMAFMSFHHLVRLETDADLRNDVLSAFHGAWQLERPERNPFFHFAFVSAARAVDPQGAFDPGNGGDWIDDSIEALVMLPLDRCQWRHTNAHRLDVVRLPPQQSLDLTRPDEVPRGHAVDGRVLPVDERSFAHWNTDPWRLDQGGDGRELASGTVFLLPYHMGRYHGFIADD